MTDCKCQIDWDESQGYHILYCPLHIAAPELLEASRAAVTTIEIVCKIRKPTANGGTGLATPDEQVTLHMLRSAIAKAVR